MRNYVEPIAPTNSAPDYVRSARCTQANGTIPTKSITSRHTVVGSGVAVAAAMRAVIDGGEQPDLIMFPQNYEGRDAMARLSVKLDRTVLTNSTDVMVDGDTVTAQTPIFGGTKLVNSSFTGERPFLASFRPKSFAAEGGPGAAGEVVTAPVPDLGATGGATVVPSHVEEHSGPKLDEADIVVSGGRGLGDAEKYSMIEALVMDLNALAQEMTKLHEAQSTNGGEGTGS